MTPKEVSLHPRVLVTRTHFFFGDNHVYMKKEALDDLKIEKIEKTDLLFPSGR